MWYDNKSSYRDWQFAVLVTDVNLYILFMKIYDLVVIGGGPAGLMAAGRAAELGAQVLLLEKNQALGIKLLMTGGGRCNLTNQLPARLLAAALGTNGQWLLSALSRFDAETVMEFFQQRGVVLRTEANGRVFPDSNQASEILAVLVSYAKTAGVDIKTNAPVASLVTEAESISQLVLKDKNVVRANNFLIATGGRSYPSSGASGDAYDWLRAIGHRVITPQAALSPIILQTPALSLEGVSIVGGRLSLYQGREKLAQEEGDFLFTAQGISGPASLNLSRQIARQSSVSLTVSLDLLPEMNSEELEAEIVTLVASNKQAEIKNIMARLLPKKVVHFLLTQLSIDTDKKGHSLTRSERLELVTMFKDWRFGILSLRGFNEAMVTVGGVDLREVDGRTMLSRLYSNLYFAGEVLDLDGPTGGYNLQVAWTTGYIAGESAAAAIKLSI